jgi:hypothetical protein
MLQSFGPPFMTTALTPKPLKPLRAFCALGLRSFSEAGSAVKPPALQAPISGKACPQTQLLSVLLQFKFMK